MSGHAVHVECTIIDAAQESGMLLTLVSQAITCNAILHQSVELHNSLV